MHATRSQEKLLMSKPYWLRRNLSYSRDFFATKELLRRFKLNTVCEEALCPNIGECWSRNEATFIILGKNCTRNCLFCNVNSKAPEDVDTEEPFKIAQAVKELQLDYVIITSVTRDDLEDRGAGQFVKTVKAIKSLCPSTIIEILIPDIDISEKLTAGVSVVGHNIEMTERLYPLIRPQADYRRSLEILRTLGNYSEILSKSAIMIGLGEEWDEIILTLKDLKNAGVSIVYIGQYLRPSKKHFPVYKYYTPSEFEAIGDIARDLGFRAVKSGPLVRSSYGAKESYLKCSSPDLEHVNM